MSCKINKDKYSSSEHWIDEQEDLALVCQLMRKMFSDVLT